MQFKSKKRTKLLDWVRHRVNDTAAVLVLKVEKNVPLVIAIE